MNEIEKFEAVVNEIKPPKADIKAGTITFDLTPLKERVNEITTKVKTLEITLDTVEQFRKLKARLNSLEDQINEEKKNVKKEFNEPYAIFEAEVKEIMGIINKANKHVASELQTYEDQQKELQKEEFEQMWASFGKDKEIPFIRIEKACWYLKKYSNKKVLAEMAEINEKIEKDLEFIDSVVESNKERDKIKKDYYNSLDMQKEYGEYIKWKNSIENDAVIDLKEKEEQPIAEIIKAAINEKIDKAPIDEPAPEEPQTIRPQEEAGTKEQVLMSFEADESIVDAVIEFLKENQIRPFVKRGKIND